MGAGHQSTGSSEHSSCSDGLDSPGQIVYVDHMACEGALGSRHRLPTHGTACFENCAFCTAKQGNINASIWPAHKKKQIHRDSIGTSYTKAYSVGKTELTVCDFNVSYPCCQRMLSMAGHRTCLHRNNYPKSCGRPRHTQRHRQQGGYGL